jgi:uncharacterized protein YjbI with pentapeptide repeats
MASDEHLSLLKQGVDAWNKSHPEDPDLRKADLYGEDLHSAILRGANLTETDLNRADLSGADLSDANLSGARLEGANLREADLNGANLSGARLEGANLREADLSGADLSGANFTGANLGEANLLMADLSDANLGEANLREADLGGGDLNRADLRGAYLNRAILRGANLEGADLRRAYLEGVDLSGARLEGADLRGAHLENADLNRVNFTGADLSDANLQQANLIDARLDGANLTGAKLWETQRAGWSIKDVSCQRAFWDRTGDEPTDYEEGEFERIFAEKPRIVLSYPGGMLPVDLFALPLIVERLQTEHPDTVLQVRSVQNDAGGASVTITVEDLSVRAPEEFAQKLVRIQTMYECVAQERDRIQGLFLELSTRMAEVRVLPRQEIHIHRPSGLTAIEGPVMSGDTYNISGQAGAVGPGAHAQDNTFQQIQSGIDLPKLAVELGRLRDAMKGEATGTREQDEAIGAVADAEEAAVKGDGPAALRYLKSAGEWARGIAEKIGVAVVTEALKKAM